MNRIGILSINLQVFSPNYGSTLQSFALWKTLTDLGCDAEIVDYDCVGRRYLDAKKPYRIFRRWCRPVGNTLWWQYFLNRRAGIRKWNDMHVFLRTKARVSPMRLTTEHFENDRYGLYVVGSDTVWDFRAPQKFDPAYFGTLACMRKVIAYAPRFGESVCTPDEADRMRPMLEKFSALSVREPVNMDALGPLRDRCSVVLDPTLLLSRKAYAELAEQPRIKTPYLLYYVVYDQNPAVTRKVDAFAKTKGWKVVEVSFFSQNAHPLFWRVANGIARRLRLRAPFLLRWGGGFIRHDIRYGATTQEFLGLMQNAEMVVTNSFHGSVFAIQFGKPFFNFTRKGVSSKLRWICESFGLEGRTLGPDDDLNDRPIDYANIVYPTLERLRKESLDYLKRAVAAASED